MALQERIDSAVSMRLLRDKYVPRFVVIRSNKNVPRFIVIGCWEGERRRYIFSGTNPPQPIHLNSVFTPCNANLQVCVTWSQKVSTVYILKSKPRNRPNKNCKLSPELESINPTDPHHGDSGYIHHHGLGLPNGCSITRIAKQK